MFFRKKAQPDSEAAYGAPGGEAGPAVNVPEAHRVQHGGYTILPVPKQLHNGNWIVRVYLEQEMEEGLRRYDFLGPMAEFAEEAEARDAGVRHAQERLDRGAAPKS